MSIYEYEEKYSSKRSAKSFSRRLRLILFAGGAVVLACMFSVFKIFYDINVYAGYVSAGVLVVLFALLYVVPVVGLLRQRKFDVYVNAYSAGRAKRHNAKVRRYLAEKIVDCYTSAGEANWYGGERVLVIADALKSGDDKRLRSALNEVYSTDVKRAARDIIRRSAVRSGLYSAVSQKDAVDALLVAAVNLQMIKDIVYLYGFRPSDAGLVKIFSKVLASSLVSYGVANIRVGDGVARAMGDIVKGIPLLGAAVSVVVDSSVQGLAGATLTAVIGRNTIKHLSREYRLQDVLDGIEVEQTEEEFETACAELKDALSEAKRSA